MKSYWSCSKLANWLRGTPKPASATSEDWRAWEKKAKEKKFRYWLAEEFLDSLHDFLCWPLTFFRNINYYIKNRWISKTHALTSNLKPGEYHEFDDRLLHAIFDELINFVEIEQAWMQVVFSKEDQKKYKTPWYRVIFRMGVWRCPKAGLDYLDWASGLKNDEDWMDKNAPDFGQPTKQAMDAQEIFKLYQWWKEERPKRPDSYDVSGYNAYWNEKQKAADAQEDDFMINGDEYSHKLLKKHHQIEQEYDAEDTEMLIRLIKIRHSLWT